MIPKQFMPDPDLLAGRVILDHRRQQRPGPARLRSQCARAGASVILSGRNGAKLERRLR